MLIQSLYTAYTNPLKHLYEGFFKAYTMQSLYKACAKLTRSKAYTKFLQSLCKPYATLIQSLYPGGSPKALRRLPGVSRKRPGANTNQNQILEI